MMFRIAVPLMVLIVAVGCSGRDATAPTSPDVRPAVRVSADQSSPEAPVEFAFEKWFTTPPAMTGNTSLGTGTFAGKILKRTAFANGVIVQLQALYMVTDPSGSRSFTALIEGTENLVTSTAVLNGVVTDGWMVGARVHVTFQVITPCEFGTRNQCFQGTIRIQ